MSWVSAVTTGLLSAQAVPLPRGRCTKSHLGDGGVGVTGSPQRHTVPCAQGALNSEFLAQMKAVPFLAGR